MKNYTFIVIALFLEKLTTKCTLFFSAVFLVAVSSTYYSQITYSFSTAGAAGATGPSQTMINTTYSNTNLNGSVTVVSGIQSWTVPANGTYSIIAYGARGTSGALFTGGNGARMSGTFSLTAGSLLKIAVGQMGLSDGCSGGGGGGSFVVTSGNIPLIVAGGGGGIRSAASQNGCPGNITTFAGSGSAGSATSNCTVKTSASSFGGIVSLTTWGSGGGGFSGTGASDGGGGGGSWSTNIIGGGGQAQGGFGGGGSGNGSCGGGGGGGYSGGDGGWIAGGGGSFNSGTNQNNTPGFNAGQGLVVIVKLFDVTISQTSTIICNGQSTGALSTSISAGAAPFTYSWSNGATTSTVGNLLAGVYSCTVVSSNLDKVTKSFTVTQPLVLTATIASQTNATCHGNNNGALSVSVIGGTSGYTYSWTPVGGVSNIAAGLAAGTYTCFITDANNCTLTQVAAITQPAQITLSVNASNTVICSGQSITLSGAGATAYLWTGGIADGVAFSPSVTSVYQVTATGANNCTVTATQLILVNPLPIVMSSATNSFICNGYSTTLIGNGAVNYTWHPVNVGTQFVSVSPSLTTNYTLNGVDANGCSNSATLLVIVNPLPLLAMSGTNTVCSGNSATLSVTGASTYVWNTSATSPSLIVSPSVTTSYTVIGTDLNGCQNTGVKTIVAINLPLVTASTTYSSICVGNSVSLYGSGAVTYLWTGGVLNNVAFSPTTSSSYSVIGIDANGCQNYASTTITVNSSPTLTINNISNSICQGETTTLIVNGANTYTWNSGQNTPTISISPITTTNYTVTGTDLNGCKNSSSFTQSVSTCTEIDVFEKNDFTFMLYPNPNEGKFTIENKAYPETLEIEIHTITNEIVFQYVPESPIIIIDITDRPNGIYLIVVKTREQFHVRKIIKQ